MKQFLDKDFLLSTDMAKTSVSRLCRNNAYR